MWLQLALEKVFLHITTYDSSVVMVEALVSFNIFF